MRSISKLTLIVSLLLIVPTGISSLFLGFEQIEASMIISQILVCLLMIIIFVLFFKLTKKYEDKSLALIDKANTVDELKALRERRISYKSKAEITKAILMLTPSLYEAENLKKYTNKTSDMVHYYATYIGSADKDKREEFKIRRDNFNKKYKNKKIAYLDFKGNLKTTGKWILAFFLLTIISSLVTYRISNLGVFIVFYIAQFVLMASFMINSIVWLVRTMKSYWEKTYM